MKQISMPKRVSILLLAIVAGYLVIMGCVQLQTSEELKPEDEKIESPPPNLEVSFTPKPGEYLYSRGRDKIHDCKLGDRESKILLIDSHLEYSKLMANQTTGPPVCPISAREGDPVVIIRGTVKNEYDRDYYVAISADLFNSREEKVGQIVDPPVCGFAATLVKSNHTGSFELHVKYDGRDIERYELFAFICDGPLP
jgi:hypothetical protein